MRLAYDEQSIDITQCLNKLIRFNRLPCLQVDKYGLEIDFKTRAPKVKVKINMFSLMVQCPVRDLKGGVIEPHGHRQE